MSLERYINSLVTVRGRPGFEWDDWRTRSELFGVSPDDYLEELSDAAVVGLTLASAEWIRARFSELEKDPTPDQAILCGWAYMLEPDAGIYGELDADDWVGPVRAPLLLLFSIVMDTLFCRQDEDPEVRTRAFWMYSIAMHVLEDDAETFDAWFKWASAYAGKLHPRSEMVEVSVFERDDRFAPPVSRELFEPESNYDPAKARSSLYQYVRSSDRQNPFIDFSALKP